MNIHQYFASENADEFTFRRPKQKNWTFERLCYTCSTSLRFDVLKSVKAKNITWKRFYIDERNTRHPLNAS
jgi:hypothetical protein